MNIVGLVTEYNPFHNGHFYHLQQSKEVTKADYSIAVMSGNYVQRGCPAFLDKWTRAEMALKSGVDMVVEIPTYYSTASAELFAFGSIRLLDAMGIINHVCFGSEAGSIDFMDAIASILEEETNDYQNKLKFHLNSGHSFAVSRTMALYDILSSNDQFPYDPDGFKKMMSSPNNILGIEYLKWLKRLKSSIQPATIRRVSAGYHDSNTTANIASASGIRKAISEGHELMDLSHTLPLGSLEGIKKDFAEGKGPIDFDDYSDLLHFTLSKLGPAKLQEILEVSEGLENRIYRMSHDYLSISDLLKELSTKRYTTSRLSRALLYALLGITKDRFTYYQDNGGPQYIKVLGFRKESQILFKHLKEKAKLPLITNMGRSVYNLPEPAANMITDEIRFTDIYTLGYKNRTYRTKETEFKHPFIVV